MENILTVRTLGVFSVSVGDKPVSDSSPRSQKLWKVFKYLLTNRHKMVTVESLIEILWPDDEPGNPQKSLHTLVSRLRKQISAGGLAGDPCILFQHGCYQLNPKLPIYLDVAEFERMITKASESADNREKAEELRKAVEIYWGGYLAESTYEAWVLPVNNYYKRLYIRTVLDLADIYRDSSAYEDVVRLCTKAIENEPYEESLYEALIQALLINGETAEAQKHYRHFTELMHKAFGAMPSEEFRSLGQAMWDAEGSDSDLFDIKRRLDGDMTRKGVFFCTTDTFNQIYQLDKRSDERMKFPVFLGLLTLVAKDKAATGNKEMKGAALALRQSLVRTLRNGDVVSQYNKNQYLLLLSAYAQPDAETAMKRVQRMFEFSAESAAFDLRINLSQIGN